MQLIDPNHPVYKPLWVRVLIVAICFGWAIIEAQARSLSGPSLPARLGIYAGLDAAPQLQSAAAQGRG